MSSTYASDALSMINPMLLKGLKGDTIIVNTIISPLSSPSLLLTIIPMPSPLLNAIYYYFAFY